MTDYCYDDPVAYMRRWAHPDSAQANARATTQPLLFVADHISIADRREGTLGIYARSSNGQPTMVVVPDGLADPTAEQCLNTVLNSIARLCAPMGVDLEVDDIVPGTLPIEALGLVHHRRGWAHITDLDRRWASALMQACGWLGIEPVGVLARTESGALVTAPMPAWS